MDFDVLIDELIEFSFQNEGEPLPSKDIMAYKLWRDNNQVALDESFRIASGIMKFAEQYSLGANELMRLFDVDKNTLFKWLSGKFLFNENELAYLNLRLMSFVDNQSHPEEPSALQEDLISSLKPNKAETAKIGQAFEVADYLYDLLEANSITEEQLAEKLGYPISYIKSVLTGYEFSDAQEKDALLSNIELRFGQSRNQPFESEKSVLKRLSNFKQSSASITNRSFKQNVSYMPLKFQSGTNLFA